MAGKGGGRHGWEQAHLSKGGACRLARGDGRTACHDHMGPYGLGEVHMYHAWQTGAKRRWQAKKWRRVVGKLGE